MMKFIKNNYQINFKNYTSFFLIVFLLNNINAKGSEINKDFFESIHKDNQIDKIYFENSISFRDHDNFDNQLRTFLGLYSVEDDKIFYPDLMFINNSGSLRENYRSRLNNMTINKKNYIIENKAFFKN